MTFVAGPGTSSPPAKSPSPPVAVSSDRDPSSHPSATRATISTGRRYFLLTRGPLPILVLYDPGGHVHSTPEKRPTPRRLPGREATGSAEPASLQQGRSEFL